MSYDLMIFEPSAAPKDRDEFMSWYAAQTEWSEDHNYDDPAVSSEPMQNFFREMSKHYPALNGPYASEDDDDPKSTDYCIGRNVIYMAFAWSLAEQAYSQCRYTAIKTKVGFFDVSSTDGEILFPDSDSSLDEDKPWWRFW